MRHFLISLALLATLCSACTQSEKTALQTGDLVFVGLPMDYKADTTSIASGITAATGTDDGINFIHTAILEVEDSTVWVIDATIKHGVDRHPLDTMLRDFTLKDGSLPTFQVMRLADNTDAAKWVENAKQYLGRPYDLYFLPDNDALYCTELVQTAYLTADGEQIFKSEPMNFKGPDGTMPPYWEWLFARLGRDIPQDEPGTNPQRMAADPVLVPVDIDLTQCMHR